MLAHQHQNREIAIREGRGMMQDVLHKTKKKKWNHSENAKKKHSSKSLEDDVPETATVETDQEVQNSRLAGPGEKKRKKKKKDRATSLGGCDASETVAVDTEDDVQNLQNVGADEKKRKIKERCRPRSEGECNDLELQNPWSAGHGEQKRKKKDRPRSSGGCDGSESATVDTGAELQKRVKKKKKKKKKRHNSRSEGACADSEVQSPRLVGDGEKKKRKHRSAEDGDASPMSMVEVEEETQHSRLLGNEGDQKDKKKHRSRSAEEAGVSESAVKTKRKLQSARLVGSGVKKKDHVKAVKDDVEITAKETPQATQNPKLVGGKGGQKKRKHYSSSAEDECVSAVEIMQQGQSSTLIGVGGNQKSKKHHYRSADGGNDSETAATDPCQESGISESADTSAKKRKKKKKVQLEININKVASLDDSEIPPKSIKKRKISSALPFETVEESLNSFKKHKVKCRPGGIAEDRTMNHPKAEKNSNFAEITAEQTKQTMYTSSIGCQETFETSKRCKRKKDSLSGCKTSGRTKNLRQDGPAQSSALSTVNTVIITPESITEPNKSLETRKRQKKKQQRSPECDNNDGSTAVQHFQEEMLPFCQDMTEAKNMQKSQLVEALKDFIPNAEKLTTETAYGMYKYDLPRFKKFKEEGISVRQGRFTKEENQQLQKNLKDFIELTGIQNEWELLHVPESSNEMIRIKQLKTKNLFCYRLAEGIPRPWKCVYQRAKKMYDPNRCKGRYTKEELEKLKRLQIVHGNHWKKIAELMDRSDVSVTSRARTVKRSLHSGPWSKKEERTLMKIMEQVMKSRIQEATHDLPITASNTDTLVSIFREKLYKRIPWFAVADQMQHRNWMQCRQKWMTILTTKMSGRMMPFGFNGYQTKINVIERLYLLNVDDVGDVDWEELCSAVGDVPPIFIQRMFYRLKTRYVPDWSKKSFGANTLRRTPKKLITKQSLL
uniref:transcription termination factor 1-like isoform X3 n=1 Tax=Pristiophorus japonicus TaxID=55135 RepID=UPI00398E5046